MNCYRIYIENTEGEATLAEEIKVMGLANFTLYKTVGYWKSTSENSSVIEMVSWVNMSETVHALARHLKARFGQDGVIVTTHKVDAEVH